MTGPHDSVIGVKAELAIQRMRTGMPVRFEPAEGDVRIEGALVECDADGRRYGDRAGARRLIADEHGEHRHEHEVAGEHEPRRDPVERRAPSPSSGTGTRAASARARRRAARRRRARGGRRRAGRAGRARSGTAARAPSRARRRRRAQRRSSARAPRPSAGRRSQIQTSDARAGRRVSSDPGDRRADAVEVLRAVARAISISSPNRWCAARKNAAPRLSIWSGRPELPAEAVAEPVGREREERPEGDRDHAREDAEADERLPAAAPPPHVRQRERHEHGRVELRRDRQPEQPEAEPVPPRRRAPPARRRVSAAGQRSKRVRITCPSRSGKSATAASADATRSPRRAAGPPARAPRAATAATPHAAISRSKDARNAACPPARSSARGERRPAARAGGYSSRKSRYGIDPRSIALP